MGGKKAKKAKKSEAEMENFSDEATPGGDEPVLPCDAWCSVTLLEKKHDAKLVPIAGRCQFGLPDGKDKVELTNDQGEAKVTQIPPGGTFKVNEAEANDDAIIFEFISLN